MPQAARRAKPRQCVHSRPAAPAFPFARPVHLTTHASRPLWRECPLPRTCTRKARFLAARVRSPTATEYACAAAATAAALSSPYAPLSRRVAADLAVSARRCRATSQGTAWHTTRCPLSPMCCHAALPAPHIRTCSGSRLCVLHRLHSTSRSRKNWNHTIDTGSRINQSRPRVTAAAQA